MLSCCEPIEHIDLTRAELHFRFVTLCYNTEKHLSSLHVLALVKVIQGLVRHDLRKLLLCLGHLYRFLLGLPAESHGLLVVLNRHPALVPNTELAGEFFENLVYRSLFLIQLHRLPYVISIERDWTQRASTRECFPSLRCSYECNLEFDSLALPRVTGFVEEAAAEPTLLSIVWQYTNRITIAYLDLAR